MAKLIELNVFERVAFADPETNKRAQRFLMKHGWEKAGNQHDLAEKLAELVDEKGEPVLEEFLSLHPDAKHFQALKVAEKPAVLAEKPVTEKPTAIKMPPILADCGCSYRPDGGTDVKFNNTSGPESTVAQESVPHPKLNSALQFFESYSVPITIGVVAFTLGIAIRHFGSKKTS